MLYSGRMQSRDDTMPSIVFQPVTLATASADHQGQLLLVDGRLAAVLAHLLDEMHGPKFKGAWFLEASFGSFADAPRVFATLEEVVAWVAQHL